MFVLSGSFCCLQHKERELEFFIIRVAIRECEVAIICVCMWGDPLCKVILGPLFSCNKLLDFLCVSIIREEKAVTIVMATK